MASIILRDGFVVLQHPTGRVEISISNPNEVMKKIAFDYGIYSTYDEDRDYRVMLKGNELIVEKDISYHGSPCWEEETRKTLSDEQVEAYNAFQTVLRYMENNPKGAKTIVKP